ncbi:cysteine hydrolase family protein [Chloroflexota bacterium]
MREQDWKTLRAEMSPLEIDLKRSAVIVIDMQNAFVKKGGMFDLGGRDISHISPIIETNGKIIDAARVKNVKVVYVVHRLTSDVREVGPLSRYRFNPDLDNPEVRRGSILEGTWGTEIIDELKPREDEMVIVKRRFSAFHGTELDMMLKTFDIRYLIFTGVATNICVESSLRDASHLQYLPVLVSDAVAASPPSRQESSVDNIKEIFGWVTVTESVLEVLKT